MSRLNPAALRLAAEWVVEYDLDPDGSDKILIEELEAVAKFLADTARRIEEDALTRTLAQQVATETGRSPRDRDLLKAARQIVRRRSTTQGAQS